MVVQRIRQGKVALPNNHNGVSFSTKETPDVVCFSLRVNYYQIRRNEYQNVR